MLGSMANNSSIPQWCVTADDPTRRQLWLRLFDTAALPITSPFPDEVADARGITHGLYYLDTRRLQPQHVRALASYLAARQWGLTVEAALTQIQRDGWTIAAAGCVVVATGEGEETAV